MTILLVSVFTIVTSFTSSEPAKIDPDICHWMGKMPRIPLVRRPYGEHLLMESQSAIIIDGK